MSTEVIHVEPELIGMVIGHEGVVRRTIELSTGCDLSINSETGEVTISGANPKDIEEAVSLVKTYAKPHVKAASREYTIPDAFRGAILGIRGNAIKLLQGITGCRVKVSEPNESGSTTIYVTGYDEADVAKAISKIEEIVESEKVRTALKNGDTSIPHFSAEVTVPSNVNFAAVCGRDWRYLLHVAILSGAHIVGTDQQDPRVLRITAPTAAGVSSAQRGIEKLIHVASNPRPAAARSTRSKSSPTREHTRPSRAAKKA